MIICRHNPLVIALLVSMSVPELSAQPETHMTQIELAAVRIAMDRAPVKGGANLIIAINPNVVRESDAPGRAEVGRRGDTRNAQLIRAFGVRSLTRGEAYACQQSTCELRAADVFISLSEPRLNGDSASISVTIEMRGAPRAKSHRQYYETINVRLVRATAGWTVAGVTQLGIT